MDRQLQRSAMRLHADLERLLRAKAPALNGMVLHTYIQLLREADMQHPNHDVLSAALEAAEQVSTADEDDPFRQQVQIADALVVVGQILSLPMSPPSLD